MIDFAKSSILGRSLVTNTDAAKASVLACHMLAGPPYEAQGVGEKRIGKSNSKYTQFHKRQTACANS